MLASVASDAGRVRVANEDWFCLCQLLGGRRPVLMAVADGMGGYEAGEVASRLAVEETRCWVEKHVADGQDLLPLLQAACTMANTRIYQVAVETLGWPGMGSTLTVALWDGNRLALAHVGDSRAYLIRNGSLSRLTDDHSVVGILVQSGELGESEAMRHPQRNLLTKALGTEPVVSTDVAEYTVVDGDVIILCTDGLTNMVTGEEMLATVSLCRDLSQLGGQLVELANVRGGHDNITVLAVGIDGTKGGEGT